MNIDIDTEDPKVTCVRLAGRLDTTGVDRVETRFTAATVARNVSAMVDLAGVSFISSMGIRMLISAARAMHQRQSKLVLFGAQPLVDETLRSMSVDALMALVPDEPSARALAAN